MSPVLLRLNQVCLMVPRIAIAAHRQAQGEPGHSCPHDQEMVLVVRICSSSGIAGADVTLTSILSHPGGGESKLQHDSADYSEAESRSLTSGSPQRSPQLVEGDVAPAHHQGDLLAMEPVLDLQGAGQGRRAGVLGETVGLLQVQHHSLL